MQPTPELWLLEIDRPWEHYCVLGRFAWSDEGLPARDVEFAEIGLPADAEPRVRASFGAQSLPKHSSPTYLVWDFWKEKLVGELGGEFPAEELAEGECRGYGIRPALGRPQVLATNRHIGQGAHELIAVRWADGKLSGRMKLPAGRAFSVFIYVPEGYRLAQPESEHMQMEREGPVLRLTLKSERGGWADWSARFQSS